MKAAIIMNESVFFEVCELVEFFCNSSIRYSILTVISKLLLYVFFMIRSVEHLLLVSDNIVRIKI